MKTTPFTGLSPASTKENVHLCFGLAFFLGLALVGGCEKFGSGADPIDAGDFYGKETDTDLEREQGTETDGDTENVVETDTEQPPDEQGTDDPGEETEPSDDSDTAEDGESDTNTNTNTDSDSSDELNTESGPPNETDPGGCIDEDGDDWCLPFDCDDQNANANQDQEEIGGDSVDNDCDGLTDELSEKDMDQDGDGFTPNQGDCDDLGDGAEFVNPYAIEDRGEDGTGDGVDNDCDGLTDETEECDCLSVGTGPWDFVDAIDLCNHKFVEDSVFSYSATRGEQAYDTLQSMGNNNCLIPRRKCEMAAMSTGPVGQADPNAAVPLSDMQIASASLDPLPEYTGSTRTDGVKKASCDRAQFRLNLRAPTNALGFSFDFLFASAEYPEWVDRGFNDTFYAIIEHQSINGGAPTNISFDSDNNEIEVDVNFFENSLFPCDESGSGWAPPNSGSTGWLKTTWNINPGDRFSLTFSIHDEGDCRFDSIVFIDNFVWKTSPVKPGTEPI